MSAKVLMRRGHSIDEEGRIHYDEVEITHAAAQLLCGEHLDRRKTYCVIDGKVCHLITFVSSCSGCYETEDGQPVGNYPWDDKNKIHLGAGCSECGYSGKIRNGYWLPIDGSLPGADEGEF